MAAARTELRASLALVSAVLRAHPQLADPLRTLVRHRTADLAIVDPDARLQPPRRRVPHRLPEAVRLVARDAARQESLRRHQAQEASSGDLARVLASMSASEAQHVVLLAGVKGAHR